MKILGKPKTQTQYYQLTKPSLGQEIDHDREQGKNRTNLTEKFRQTDVWSAERKRDRDARYIYQTYILCKEATISKFVKLQMLR